MNPAQIDVAVLAVVISGMVLLIQLYRWLAGFASKPEVAKVETTLNDKFAANAALNSIAFARIEGQIKEHRSEATTLLEKVSSQVGGVMGVVQENTAKIGALNEWRHDHTAEDAVAHSVIGEVRDFMAISRDRDRRVDEKVMATRGYKSKKMKKERSK